MFMAENNSPASTADCLSNMEMQTAADGGYSCDCSADDHSFDNVSSQSQENIPAPLPKSPEESGVTLLDTADTPSNWTSYPEDSFTYGEVRFLIAASTPFPLTISIDNTVYAQNARFGTIGAYNFVPDGFHNVTITRGSGPRTVLFEKMFPFRAGEKSTMVILDSETTGLGISQLSDTPCNNLTADYGCYRVANMSFVGSFYDILLQTGETVFHDVSYNTVTPYKQAQEGSWIFQVAGLSCSDTYREIPVISSGIYRSSCTWSSPVLTIPTEIAAGKSYTTYLIGNHWSDYSLRAVTVED